MKVRAIVHQEMPVRRLAKPHYLCEHRVEHGSEVTGRGVDDAQDLGGRGLLLQPLVTLGFARVTLGSALRKLTFEIGYPLLGTGERAVGSRAHFADLVGTDLSRGSYRDRHGRPKVVARGDPVAPANDRHPGELVGSARPANGRNREGFRMPARRERSTR